MSKTKEEIEAVAKELVDAILAVHRELGPGLLESAYQACLAHELRSRGIDVRCEVELPVIYRTIAVQAGYRIDMPRIASSSRTSRYRFWLRSMKRNC
jgi:hypothetical protein